MAALRIRVIGSAALCMLVAGCTVGPNYKRPSAPAPPAFKEAAPPPSIPNGTWKQAQPSDQALRGKWWEIYNDPQLNALEEKVAISNQTLKAATEQYFSARATVQIARANYFPTLGVGSAISRQQLSENRPTAVPGSKSPCTAISGTGHGAGRLGNLIFGGRSGALLKARAPMRRQALPIWPM